jgi:hypothetical protein
VKFASDRAGLYGDYENAMKACGHELKGLTALASLYVSGLHVPLCCLITHRGSRAAAMALLPVSGVDTLVFGSADAGAVVLDRSPELRAIAEKAGR